MKKPTLTFIRRSTGEIPSENTQVILGDTMGELMLMYGISDICVLLAEVWVKHGGHNPLEPLAFKLPVVSGKHTFNFPEVFTSLLEVQGVLQINSTEKALSEIIGKLLNSKGARQRLGNAGYEVLIENRGALQRLLDLLHPYLTNISENNK